MIAPPCYDSQCTALIALPRMSPEAILDESDPSAGSTVDTSPPAAVRGAVTSLFLSARPAPPPHHSFINYFVNERVFAARKAFR